MCAELSVVSGGGCGDSRVAALGSNLSQERAIYEEESEQDLSTRCRIEKLPGPRPYNFASPDSEPHNMHAETPRCLTSLFA